MRIKSLSVCVIYPRLFFFNSQYTIVKFSDSRKRSCFFAVEEELVEPVEEILCGVLTSSLPPHARSLFSTTTTNALSSVPCSPALDTCSQAALSDAQSVVSASNLLVVSSESSKFKLVQTFKTRINRK